MVLLYSDASLRSFSQRMSSIVGKDPRQVVITAKSREIVVDSADLIEVVERARDIGVLG
jgi:hypothetical protein